MFPLGCMWWRCTVLPSLPWVVCFLSFLRSASGSTSYPSRWLRRPPGCSSTTRAPARGSSSRPATLARPHALAATATARARTARQTCRNCRRIATSTPLSPRNPRSHTVHLCDARPASGAGCALSLCVRVRRPSLPGDDCSIYLFISLCNKLGRLRREIGRGRRPRVGDG